MSLPSEADRPHGYAAFVRLVAADPALTARLRLLRARAELVEAAVAEGAARGFRFDAAEMEAAMREGMLTWLRHGDDHL